MKFLVTILSLLININLILCNIEGTTQIQLNANEITISAFDDVINEKYRKFADYVDSISEDNDATVDPNNLPPYPTHITCSIFRQKLMACTDIVMDAGYETHFMVNNLIKDGHLKSKRLETVMREVDKEEFAPMNPLNKSHYDYSVDIGHGTWMEPPYQIAGSLEYLKRWISPSSKILEIGAGTGYMTALMASLGGMVYAMEHVSELSRKILDNVGRGAPRTYFKNRIHVICEDGRNGYPKEAPYDVIYVSGSYPDVPWKILEQLKPGHPLILTIDKLNGDQVLTAVHKYENDTTSITPINSNMFLPPLLDLKTQLDKKLVEQLKNGGRLIFSEWRPERNNTKHLLCIFNKHANESHEKDIVHRGVYLPPITDLHTQLHSKDYRYDIARTYKPWMWFTRDYEEDDYFKRNFTETRMFTEEYYDDTDVSMFGVRSPMWWNEADSTEPTINVKKP